MNTGNTDSLKVLYVGGWGRSGSTILSNLLNEIEGFFHIGELRYIWENGLIKKRLCGCGQTLDDCEVWRPVFEQAFGGIKQIDPHVAIRQRDESPQNRAVLKDLLGLYSISWVKHQAYLEILARLYQAIRIVTGCTVIVDSSKTPAHGYLLDQVPGLEVYYLHLVRDARATAFSWQRKVRRQDGGDNTRQGEFIMTQHTVVENAKRWMLCNAISELIGRQCPGRYLRVRYEDFVRHPARTVRRLVDFAGSAARQFPFTTSHEAILGTNHTVWGNPFRNARGPVQIQRDDAWKTKMDRVARWGTGALTWPLLWHYDYLNREI